MTDTVQGSGSSSDAVSAAGTDAGSAQAAAVQGTRQGSDASLTEERVSGAYAYSGSGDPIPPVKPVAIVSVGCHASSGHSYEALSCEPVGESFVAGARHTHTHTHRRLLFGNLHEMSACVPVSHAVFMCVPLIVCVCVCVCVCAQALLVRSRSARSTQISTTPSAR